MPKKKTHCGVSGHLVTITSSAENTAVTTVVDQCADQRVAWIGLSDHEVEGTFQWVTGEPYAYNSFCGSEPNGGTGENYAEIMIDNGCWNDVNLAGYNNVDKFVVEFHDAPEACDGGAMTDPHFKSWSGEMFDFMGECDLHLVNAPYFVHDDEAAAGLVVDIRTKIRYDYSYIESIVLKIGDESLEVGSFGEYFFNGIDTPDLPETMAGFPLNHVQVNKKRHEFTIDVGKDEKIVIFSLKDMVSIQIHGADASRFHDSYGMMGEFGTGTLFGRDGNTVFDEDPVALAAEWQVRDDEPMLFQSVQGPQYPTKCVMPAPAASKATDRRLGESIAREAAEKACTKYGTSGATFDACVYDVMATGDLDMADAGAF